MQIWPPNPETKLKNIYCLCQASRWPLNITDMSLKTLSSLVVLCFHLQSMWLSDLIPRQLPLAHSCLQIWVKMWVLIKEHLLSIHCHLGFTLSCLGIGVFFKDFLRPVSNAMRCLSRAQIEWLPPQEAPSLIALLDQWRNTQNNEQGEIREERSINYFCLAQLSDSFSQAGSSPALERLLLSVIPCVLLNQGSSDSSLLFLSSAWLSLLLSVLLSPVAVWFAVVYSIIIDHFVREWKMQFMHHTAYTQTTPLWLAGLALHCWNFLGQKKSLSALILFCGWLCKIEKTTECYGMAAEAFLCVDYIENLITIVM